MSQKNLIYLSAVAVLLAVICWFALPGTGQVSSEGSSDEKLFADIDSQDIGEIKIEQGTQSVNLQLKDKAWTLPARGNYPADSSKVRALQLKISDLSGSQKIPYAEGSLEKLGVDDDAVKRGMSRITLLDAQSKPLAVLHLGEARKNPRDKSAAAMLAGQYARRDERKEIYLLPSPMTLNLELSSWLEVNLINVLQTAIFSVMQTKTTETGEEVLFELVRTGNIDPQVKAPQLALADGLPEGKTLQQSVVVQIRSGLENLRIADVYPEKSDEVKNLKFDFSSYYKTSNGLVYHVSTAQSGEKTFLKLSVTFDAELAKVLAEAERLKQEALKAAATPTPTPTAKNKDEDEPARRTPETASSELKLSDEAEAAKLTAQFKPWIYELPSYQARKLRNTKTDLTEPPAPPKAPPMPPPVPPADGQ